MRQKINIAKIYLFVIYVLPCFFGYLTLNKGQLLYLLIYFIISIILSSFVIEKPVINLSYFIILFLLLSIHYIISTVINFRNNSVSINDITEVLRPVIYFFSFYLSIIILQPYVKRDGVICYLDYFEKIVFYFSFIEYLKYFELFKPFFYLYSPAYFNTINYTRLSGTVGFAYGYAWILLVLIIYNAVKTRGVINFRFFYFSLLLILTGSRTGVAGLLAIYFCLFIFLKKIRMNLLLFIMVLSLIIFILYKCNIDIVVLSIDYIASLIKTFSGVDNNASFVVRNYQNMEGLRRFFESPIYGTGSNKNINGLIENFYFHHLGTWGILGIIIYLIIIFSFYICIPSKFNRSLYGFIIIISFILCFSTPIFDQIRLFNIYYAVIAILIIDNNEAKKYKMS